MAPVAIRTLPALDPVRPATRLSDPGRSRRADARNVGDCPRVAPPWGHPVSRPEVCRQTTPWLAPNLS